MPRPTFNDIAEFMKEMRRTGHFADGVIKRRASGRVYDPNQFVVACIVSGREILELDDTVLKHLRVFYGN